MIPAEPRRDAEALEWVRRIQDPHFADWDAHVLWLESDPRNADAFDAMALAIDDAAAALDGVPPQAVANDNADAPVVATPERRRRRWFAPGLGVAAAAVLVGVVSAPTLFGTGAGAQVIGTGMGERRLVTLPDGSRIALNGDSAVRINRGDPRAATLLRGEAFFAIVHDPAHPFVAQAGGATFRDIGTAFDMTRTAGGVRVAVREGAVLYDPGATAVRIDRGKAIEIARDEAVVRSVDAAAVGGWRSGRLSYRDAAMSDVAADLARSIGVPVRLDPRVAARRFSGVIIVDPDRSRMFGRVAAVTGTEIRRDGAGWRMALPPQ